MFLFFNQRQHYSHLTLKHQKKKSVKKSLLLDKKKFKKKERRLLFIFTILKQFLSGFWWHHLHLKQWALFWLSIQENIVFLLRCFTMLFKIPEFLYSWINCAIIFHKKEMTKSLLNVLKEVFLKNNFFILRNSTLLQVKKQNTWLEDFLKNNVT